MCLVGQITSEKTAAGSVQPQTLLSPLVSTGSTDSGMGGGGLASPGGPRPRSPTGRRSPLLRTKKMGPLSYIPNEVKFLLDLFLVLVSLFNFEDKLTERGHTKRQIPVNLGRKVLFSFEGIPNSLVLS